MNYQKICLKYLNYLLTIKFTLMKSPFSIFTLLLSLIICSTSPNPLFAKDGGYVGLDYLISNAKFKYAGEVEPEDKLFTKKSDSVASGVGIVAGYQKSYKNIFIAPELFYDYLNSSTRDYSFKESPYHQDTMEIRSRYGAKLNLGYSFNDQFSTYLTYGFSSLDYVIKFPSTNESRSRRKTSSIYGIGIVYNFAKNWGMKLEFNTQRFNVPYELDLSDSSKVRLNVLKTGLIYNF